ncbi:MAG: DUF3048 domain-containing protein [Actinomycetota bacterium]|jgi:Protein of unknown function (DUF3048) N-terminal domain/Protein of unknown function (DUF3048) C-terminal domain
MKKIVVLLLVAVLGGAGVYYGPSLRHRFLVPATTTTTTTTIPFPIAPLSGVVDTTRLSITRPSLLVKVENTPDALPQWGIELADVVYEEIVNGGITRLAVVFNSQVPAKIGPVRSVRPTDTQIVWPLGGLFAFSGGARYAINSIRESPTKLITEGTPGSGMFRDPHRYAPHNLYAHGNPLFKFKALPTPPPALFQYLKKGQKVKGKSVSQVMVPFPSIYPVTWSWNKVTKSWDRTLFGKADITGTGVRESPKNLVVMEAKYVNGIGTMSSYANLQGWGFVQVFMNGKEVDGMWSRGASKADVIQYKTMTGKPLLMNPGQTWVELLDSPYRPKVTS